MDNRSGLSKIKQHEFNLFAEQPHLVHGVFARSGGTSAGPFASLNIGLNSGDAPSQVAENRKRIIRKLGMKPLVFLNQVHGDKIKVLKQGDNDLDRFFYPGKDVYTADGIITNIPDLFLVIQVADCQAVLLYDTQKRVIANVHSGWRGSVKNIIGNCVDKMVTEFGCRPENIIAGIGPSLGPCCAEFIHYKEEIPGPLWRYKIKGKAYFDFWAMSRDQLMAGGVEKNAIENMQICTRCQCDEFYSYRAQNTTGRFACVIAMA